jgi:hypothetical protein
MLRMWDLLSRLVVDRVGAGKENQCRIFRNRRKLGAGAFEAWFLGKAAALIAGFIAAAGSVLAADDKSELERGWTTLRAMDCARCHGRDYEGWTAPSLVAAVRDGSRERFDRYVLEGDIARGMPGYRSQPAVANNLDAIYAYLVARSKGKVGPGNPNAPMPPPKPSQ